MSRSRGTARQAGPKFERLIADHLAAHVDDRIDRRAKNGNKDRGDIANLRTPVGSHRVVGECKDEASVKLGSWAGETETERGNDDALAGVIFHKRHGIARAGAQWVTMTLDDFIAILTGSRP